MGINKVVFGNETLIDISDTTATASDVSTGKVFHLSDGTQATGTAVFGGGLKELVSGMTYPLFDCEDATSLKYYAFCDTGNCKIKAISADTIGAGCFSNSRATEILLGSNLTSIPDKAFYNASYLESSNLDFSKIANVGDSAFYECRLLPISGNLILTYIPNYAFQNTQKMGDIVFKNNVQVMQEGFYQSGLTSAVFEGTATLSSTRCFSICPNIKKLKFKDEATLGMTSFNGCVSLQTVIFNSSTNTISSNAFNRCNALTDIYVPWAEGAISGSPWGASNATVHYETTFDSDGEPVV